jgi:WD40 repeat protein
MRASGALVAAILWGLSSPAQAPVAAPELVVQIGSVAPQSAVNYSSDGRWIATAREEAVTIWEASTGHVWSSLLLHSGPVRALSFSPDSRWLASGGDDHSVIIWDIATRRVVRRVTTGNERVGAVAFSPDGTHLIAGTGRTGVVPAGGAEDSSPYIWDTTSWETSRLTPPHHGAVDAVQFSRNGKYIATGGQDGAVVLWDAVTRRPFRVLKTGRISALSFNSDGQMLATIYGTEIRIWNLGGGAPRVLIQPAGIHAGKPGPSDVRFSPDGRWLAAANGAGDIQVWDTATYQQAVSLQGFPKMAFSPDSSRLLAQEIRRTSIFEIASGREVASLGGVADPAGLLAATQDGKWLATGHRIGGLRLWDTGTGRQARVIGSNYSRITAATFSPDGHTLAASTYDGDVIFWRLPDGVEIRKVHHEGHVTALAFDPNGRWLASAAYSLDGPRDTRTAPIKVWDSATGREVHLLFGHTSMVGALAFAPDGKLLASGSRHSGNSEDGAILIWDLQTWRESRRLPGHAGGVVSLAFSPDSRRLVSAGGFNSDDVDSTERIWDVATGAQLWARSRPGGGVWAVAFSPDGRWIAGGGWDGSLQLSDASGQLAKVIRAHNSRVESVAFTSGGRLLVSTSYADSTRVWDPATGRLLAVLATRGDSADWLVASPNGLFDGSSGGVQDLAVWRIGLRTYSPDRFFTDYYSPGLLTRLFAGERPEPSRQVAVLHPAPDVHITEPRTGAEFSQSPVTVRVEATDTGGGLREVRLYNNGKLVSQRDAGTGHNPAFTFTVDLAAGSNHLSAIATNAERTESPAAMVEAVFRPPAPRGRPVLWVLAVGINQYEDSRFTLRYARPDAEAIADFFQRHRAERLFSDARVVRRLDRDATRAGIKQALAQIADQAKPEDVMLIYLAGHGTVLGEQFYFLSEEMRSGIGADDEAAVRRYGLPASEFGDALRAAKAQKQILVIDACQAGGALTQIAKLMLTRGLRESEQMDRATQMLARAAGTHLIAAATEKQYAVEVPELGHGLLTSALLTGLGEKGSPEAAASADGTVTILGLLQYVNRVVPEWTERYHAGNKQYPVSNTNGMDFPLWAK